MNGVGGEEGEGISLWENALAELEPEGLEVERDGVDDVPCGELRVREREVLKVG